MLSIAQMVIWCNALFWEIRVKTKVPPDYMERTVMGNWMFIYCRSKIRFMFSQINLRNHIEVCVFPPGVNACRLASHLHWYLQSVFCVKKERVAVMGKFQNSAHVLANCKSWVNLRIVLADVFQNDETYCDFCGFIN